MTATYDRFPSVRVPGADRIRRGDDQVYGHLARAASASGARTATVVIDCYPGVDVAAVCRGIRLASPAAEVIDLEETAARPAAELDRLLAPDLTDDRVFGRLAPRRVADFYDGSVLGRVRSGPGPDAGTVTFIVGWGASLVAPDDAVVVLADLPRWEVQQRFRRGAGNWRAENATEPFLAKYKRGFFIEWRTADEHKLPLIERCDFLLDTTSVEPKLMNGDDFRRGLEEATRHPFRIVPYFDPGPWGGTWMLDHLGLDPLDSGNYAWAFDCVPEENSLLLEVGDEHIEVPSLDVVLRHPLALLGDDVFRRFGAEFPIRFDMLDTVGGGNLSLQVHPLTSYIRETFGMSYTQDESYYLLDAAPGAQVYLGLRDDVEPERMAAALREAEAGGAPFDADEFVTAFPARKHDHFLIPAGTVHASGAGSMVLEISATPYIFTFKLWDWGRLGLDGIPRPIHLDHGLANIQWGRRTRWAETEGVNAVQQVVSGDGWAEERTGLHELEFIETRRHWFTVAVDHDTGGTVNVLNLVEGDEVVVESPDGAFDDVTIHYAETFIVPARVGAYRIRPAGTSDRYATIKAFVRP